MREQLFILSSLLIGIILTLLVTAVYSHQAVNPLTDNAASQQHVHHHKQQLHQQQQQQQKVPPPPVQHRHGIDRNAVHNQE